MQANPVTTTEKDTQPITLPRPYPQSFSLGRIWSVLERHGDLAISTSYFVLNTFVLIGKVFKGVAETIGNSAKAGLSFSGSLYLPKMMQNTKKYWNHFQVAVKVRSVEGCVAMLAHSFNTTVDLFLTAGGITISLARLARSTGIVSTYFTYTRPIALVSFAVKCIFDLYRPRAKSRIYDKVLLLCQKDDNHVNQACLGIMKNSSTLSSEISRNLDFEVWESFKAKISQLSSPEEKRNLLRTLLPYYRTAHVASFGEWLLNIWGYVCRSICAAYPDTIAEAAIIWVSQIPFLAKLLLRKCTEFQALKEIEQIKACP